MSVGCAVASQKAKYRQKFGNPVIWKGKTYFAIVKILKQRADGFVPAGTGLNAAFADTHTFEFTPTDFTNGSPAEGDTLTFEAVDYLVLEAPPPLAIGSSPNALLLVGYRAPKDDTAPSDAAQVIAFPDPP